ncbi:MAG TPA: hypothetical protein VKA49_15030 [Flavitalea sp.]|nr:hypothetical protein [Flavitalea sp.]
MKKISVTVMFFVSFCSFAFEQTTVTKKEFPSFESAMLQNIAQIDTVSAPSVLVTIANNFERIGQVEKTKWQPWYYASYCYTAMAFMSPDKTKIDLLADKAESLLQQAEAIEKNNSEITTLFAMINSCRIMVDPVSRFPTKGKEVHELINKAKIENEHNPRIYLLQARMELRTPEAFGGGKDIAKLSAEKAIEKFTTFKPEDRISPNWGEAQAKSFLAKISTRN